MTDDMGQLEHAQLDGASLDVVEVDDEAYEDEEYDEGEAGEGAVEDAVHDILAATEAIYERLDDLLAEQQYTNRLLAMLVAATGRPDDAAEAADALQAEEGVDETDEAEGYPAPGLD
jgi:hypothetical protein